MGLFLRCTFLCHQKLFKQEISLKRLVAHNVYNRNIKKFNPILQLKHFSSKKDEHNDRELIYVGMLSNKIRHLRLFSFSSTLISILLQPKLYKQLMLQENMAHISILFVLINVLFWCSPLLVHTFTKRYAIRMYYNLKEGNYSVTVYNFFLREKEIVFKAEDIKVNNVTAIFSNCTVKGMPMFINKDDFSDTKHYYNIMEQRKLEDFEVEGVAVNSINQSQINERNHCDIEDKHKKEQ